MNTFFFFFNETATTEIYTLSLHDALPISDGRPRRHRRAGPGLPARCRGCRPPSPDRKSTRLNSSHVAISYAVFCLKKKNARISACLPQYRGHILRCLVTFVPSLFL